MRSLDFGRDALTSCVAAAMLTGCGGAQPPIGPLGAALSVQPTATAARRGASSMLHGAKSADLIYIANTSDDTVLVYSYPKGKLVGTLTALPFPLGECVDRSGDVYIVTGYSQKRGSLIYEYAHASTNPIATLTDEGSGFGCAVNQTTGQPQ
jgi:hypothetical protein